MNDLARDFAPQKFESGRKKNFVAKNLLRKKTREDYFSPAESYLAIAELVLQRNRAHVLYPTIDMCISMIYL